MEAADCSRTRIIQVAARLFALHGVPAVSIRKITEEAEVNLASVNYYFGAKGNLVHEVYRRKIDCLLDCRLSLLYDLGKESGVREVVAAYLRPLYDVAWPEDENQDVNLELLRRAAADPVSCIPDDSIARITEVLHVFVEVLHRMLPDLPKMLLYKRLQWSVFLVLAQANHPKIQAMHSDWETSFEDLLDFCVAGVTNSERP